MDVSDFYQTFFEEADELLADMEQHLLMLECDTPDTERLNAIFRAAHSIKGGAGTFGFTLLQETTHILENLLDEARCGKLQLNSDIINVFLETKDIMQEQLEAYKSAQEPDRDAAEVICQALREIALENKHESAAQPVSVAASSPLIAGEGELLIVMQQLKEHEAPLMVAELANLGNVIDQQQQGNSLQVRLQTVATADDISAVLCFVLDAGQITITGGAQPLPAVAEAAVVIAVEPVPVPPPVPEPVKSQTAVKEKPPVKASASESGSIRVAVEKVDQIINQVGELIITQAMLSQLTTALDPAQHATLLHSIGQLERNARDLQESVMSVRMMPMEYVFSRFPRLVHELGKKLNKEVELTLKGGSAELDKSLIERIIDPLTHLVRNSLDHGIEAPEVRRQKGKPAKGNLTLSAEHHGGNIVIEVTDDGAGLNREKILARAQSQGVVCSDSWSDEEVWMLIFAAGFSTAEQVTDVSGRGVGMDVVRRNILAMGGYVEVHSEKDKGSTIRVLLPLTLAILDGMSVMVGEEVYVLPLGSVMESLKPSENTCHQLSGDGSMLLVRGEYLPMVSLHKVFNVDSHSTELSQSIAVIVQHAGSRYALLVDRLVGQHQVVVKNLEINYRKVAGISAATILGDGSVALIVDIAGLAALCKSQPLL